MSLTGNALSSSPDAELRRDLARQTHLDWRWCAVNERTQGRRPWWLALGDRWVECARRYVVARRQASDCQAIARRFPGLHRAWQIWTSATWERTFLEARILAGGEQPDIAARSGIDVKAVRAFEAIFFDCRSHLRASDWIMANAVGVQKRLSEPRPLQQVVMSIAYSGGPEVAECAIAVASKMTGQPTTIEISSSTESRCRRLIELLMEPLNERTAAKCMRTHARMLVAEARMSMGAEEPLMRTADVSRQQWPDELADLAWDKLAKDIRAGAIRTGAVPTINAA